MELNYHKQSFITRKAKGRLFRKSSVRYLVIVLITVVFILLTGCEDIDRFYRPDLPEKLCSIGIIDADDTTNYDFSFRDFFDIRNSMRFISFEKSYQKEFPVDMADSLREISLKISTINEELYSYSSTLSLKGPIFFEIPDSINFASGEKYYFRANEKDFPEIMAECTVPGPPPGITLISHNKETTVLSEQLECYHPFDSAYTAVFSISFNNNSEQNYYYALIIEGGGTIYPFPNPIMYYGPINFMIRESNTQGFFAEMQGLNTFHHICEHDGLSGEKYPVYAYFIDGSKTFDNKCLITLSTKFHDSYSPIAYLSWVRIKLLSIPEELYLYEKSLYTYKNILDDPFAEPVYLNGNIIGGNGVFAICRSKDLTINLSPPY
jgi:hypothetical protein